MPPELAAIIREEASRANGQDSGKTNDATADSDNTDTGEDVLANTYRFCRAWLRHFARKFLDEGSGFNAAKHGLSTVAGYSQVAFHPDPDA